MTYVTADNADTDPDDLVIHWLRGESGEWPSKVSTFTWSDILPTVYFVCGIIKYKTHKLQFFKIYSIDPRRYDSFTRIYSKERNEPGLHSGVPCVLSLHMKHTMRHTMRHNALRLYALYSDCMMIGN